jgi:S-adenosylmethionine:tRNA ribosyltransferase-isomerase
MKTSDFDYALPESAIAQTPASPRDTSRLLVLDRKTGRISHRIFREVGGYLQAGDVLVVNQTRVIPARLFGSKLPGGGRVELLLIKRLDPQRWECLGGGKGLKPGRQIQLDGGPFVEIEAQLDGPRRIVRFEQPPESYIDLAGQMPLPPYIHTPLQDRERYQTVYARDHGSAAAPTAGLHFTPELLAALTSQGIQIAPVTLHVGLDTFAPVTEETPAEHTIHTEWCHVPDHSAAIINQARKAGGKIVAVGTTSVRTLETAAGKDGLVKPFEGPTHLYILPGYHFRMVDHMITNFHLPRSTLIMMVSAFAGRERVLETYQLAISEGYRFYSFGDAMLIL